MDRFGRSLTGRKPTFRRAETGNSYRMLLWMFLILAMLWILLQLNQPNGAVQPLFLPTPTATRTAGSFILEAQAYAQAGRIDDPGSDNDALGAYQRAIASEPGNIQARTELARLLTYSSALLPTTEQRRARLEDARRYIQEAAQLAPDDSNVHAVYAFVLDWSASPTLYGSEKAQELLLNAEQEASRALLLDPNNPLALTFYAEILVDLQKWTEAQNQIEQAVRAAPDLMDAYRVYGYVLEAQRAYSAAIEQYTKASQIAPNMTFLYLSIGLNYRTLALKATSDAVAKELYGQALENFDRAAKINEALGVIDPLPYLHIAKTYSQMGDFFAAARNAEKALRFDPTDANTYGQLGIIYVKSRNYEGALPVLKCAVLGCTAEENKESTDQAIAIQPLPLSSIEVAFYYLQYGSVLAALAQCEQAVPVLEMVNQAYPNDELLQSIIQEDYAICGLQR
ncbi:MAG: hypothetical protein Fur0018_02290 [Anaerolineales bacterium]